MNLFSLVVLAKTETKATYEMNLKCFQTFIESIKEAKLTYEIILIESNVNVLWEYPIEHLKTICPNEVFNFHKFLNIAVKVVAGNYIVFSNNDVVFDLNWLVELLKVANNNKSIASFSPYDIKSNKLSKVLINSKEFVLGYEIQKHLTGWCYVIKKEALHKIGNFDERFDFYYADSDYAMTLLRYGIKHALVVNAFATHLENMSINTAKDINSNISINKKKIPKYLITENWYWVTTKEKMLEGIIKFHGKWGSRRTIKLKILVAIFFLKIRLPYFNRFIMLYRNQKTRF